MTTQTRTWQRKILAAAQRDNYAGLYWFVEMTLSRQYTGSAAHPGQFVPVVPVAPDPEETRHWAHMLAELFKASNPPTVGFDPALTSLEALQTTGVPWYEFGDAVTVDVVCYGCGGVAQVDAELLAMSPAWMCGECAKES